MSARMVGSYDSTSSAVALCGGQGKQAEMVMIIIRMEKANGGYQTKRARRIPGGCTTRSRALFSATRIGKEGLVSCSCSVFVRVSSGAPTNRQAHL